MVAMRFGVTAVFAAAAFFPPMRAQFYVVAIVAALALGWVAIQAGQARTMRLRNLAVVDMATMLLVVPMSALSGFVAAQTGELLPAERSAFIELSAATLVALGILMALCLWLYQRNRTLLTAALLPGWLVPVTLTFALNDYRGQTVLGMIGVSYVLGTVGIGIGAFIADTTARYVPVGLFSVTVLAGLFVIDPGMANLEARTGIVQGVFGGLTALGFFSLLVVSQTTIDVRQLMSGGTSSRRRTGPVQRRADDD